MKYIVQSTAVWDSIQLPKTKRVINAPGGAGFYAMSGMKVWTDQVGIVTGIGLDYLKQFGDWYRDNSLPVEGMLPKDPKCPKTMVIYDDDGGRTEKPLYGEEHYRKMNASPDEVEPFCNDAEGVYVFKNIDSVYWQGILELKKRYKFKLVWEIAADAALPENKDIIISIAKQTDMFSINRAEACAICEVETVTELNQKLMSWELPFIYLRLGSRGTCLLQNGKIDFVPSVPSAVVLDVTGGGNSSTGGAFIGLCQGRTTKEIGAMGNVSASFCIQQWGVPKWFDEALRQEAQARFEKVLSLCER